MLRFVYRLISTIQPHPVVYFLQLELPKPTNAVSRQAFPFAPAIDGVLGNTKMLGHLFGSNPRFGAYGGGSQD